MIVDARGVKRYWTISWQFFSPYSLSPSNMTLTPGGETHMVLHTSQKWICQFNIFNYLKIGIKTFWNIKIHCSWHKYVYYSAVSNIQNIKDDLQPIEKYKANIRSSTPYCTNSSLNICSAFYLSLHGIKQEILKGRWVQMQRRTIFKCFLFFEYRSLPSQTKLVAFLF